MQTQLDRTYHLQPRRAQAIHKVFGANAGKKHVRVPGQPPSIGDRLAQNRCYFRVEHLLVGLGDQHEGHASQKSGGEQEENIMGHRRQIETQGTGHRDKGFASGRLRRASMIKLEHAFGRAACNRGGLSTFSVAILLNVTAFAGELPKEGAFATTTYFHDAYDAAEATPGLYMWTYEDYGIATNDLGSGFMHHMSVHCKGYGGNTNTTGGKRNADHCVLVDSDGDRILTATENTDTKSNEPLKGEATFISGSGKYAGISGKYEYEIEFLPHFSKNASSLADLVFISHEKGSYKIGPTGQ
jgi:hypothetical protein